MHVMAQGCMTDGLSLYQRHSKRYFNYRIDWYKSSEPLLPVHGSNGELDRRDSFCQTSPPSSDRLRRTPAWSFYTSQYGTSTTFYTRQWADVTAQGPHAYQAQAMVSQDAAPILTRVADVDGATLDIGRGAASLQYLRMLSSFAAQVAAF
jgi:hypothetical protein